jgi:hypothetical protein
MGANKLPAMPLEGHYARQTTPLYKLSSRETKAASAALLVTLVAMLALIFATVGDSNPATPQGCIRASVAGIVGAQTVSACGTAAEARCAHAVRFDDPRSSTIVAECESQGVPTTGKPGRVRPSDPIPRSAGLTAP